MLDHCVGNDLNPNFYPLHISFFLFPLFFSLFVQTLEQKHRARDQITERNRSQLFCQRFARHDNAHSAYDYGWYVLHYHRKHCNWHLNNTLYTSSLSFFFEYLSIQVTSSTQWKALTSHWSRVFGKWLYKYSKCHSILINPHTRSLVKWKCIQYMLMHIHCSSVCWLNEWSFEIGVRARARCRQTE